MGYGCVRPVDSFCCGCALDLGLRIILAVHTLVSFFYMATAYCNIVLDRPTFGYHVSLATQAFNCGFSLASVPFIVAGFSGVRYEIEVHLRIYLYWLMLCFLLELIAIGALLGQSSCSKIPSFLADFGGSFACGCMRIAELWGASMCVLGLGYTVFVVWSRCEELKKGSSDVNFDSLLGQGHVAHLHAAYEQAGLFGTGTILSTPNPVAYGSLATPGFGGSAKIFGGTTHEWGYSPAAS